MENGALQAERFRRAGAWAHAAVSVAGGIVAGVLMFWLARRLVLFLAGHLAEPF